MCGKLNMKKVEYWIAMLLMAHVGVYAITKTTKSWYFLLLVPTLAYVFDRIIRTCKFKKSVFALSFLMGLAQLIGENYDVSVYISDLWSGKGKLLASVGLLLGYTILLTFLITVAIHCLQSEKMQALMFREDKEENFGKLWRRYSLVLIGCWLPNLIISYPGHLMGDSNSQLAQFFGYDNGLSKGVIRIDPNVMITNHHPVLHTVLLGECVKVSRALLGSDNIGLFFFTVVQYTCLAVCLGYSVAWLTKINASRIVRLAVLGFFLVMPCFWESAVVVTKDTPFMIVLMLFVLATAEMLLGLREKVTVGWWIKYVLLIAFVILFRNNGFYVVFLSLPIAAIVGKGVRKPLLAALAATLVIQVGWNSFILPGLGITPGSKAEMLALPIEQTARYMHEFEDEITPEEKEAIEGILRYDRVMKVYDPRKGDPAKFSWRKEATSEDIKTYFVTWFKMGLKHPACYLQATACSLNGYYSFGDKCPWGYSVGSAERAMAVTNKKGFHFSSPAVLKPFRTLMKYVMAGITHLVPPIFVGLQAALYDWFLVAAFIWLLIRRRWRAAATYMPGLVLLLTNLAGPINARIYFRYMIPITMMAPVLAVILVKTRRNKEDII